MFKKFLRIFALAVVIVFFLDYFSAQFNILNFFNRNQESDQFNQTAETTQFSTTENIEQTSFSLGAEVANTNAWELLKNSDHQLVFKEYDFGIFIEEIDGLKGDENNFWAIYVNDNKSLVGIRDVILNVGDVLELRYEAIQQ